MAYLTCLLQFVPNCLFLLSRLLLEHVYFILVSLNIRVYFYTGVIIPRTGRTFYGVWSEDPFTKCEYII